MGMCGRNIQTLKPEIHGKGTEQAPDLIYLENMISELKKGTNKVTTTQ
jgi:hypothetical protein